MISSLSSLCPLCPLWFIYLSPRLARGIFMVRKRLTYLILATAWVTMLMVKFSAVDVQAGQAAQQAGSDRKIWDGVFTAEQAARGKPRFDASCSRCHNVELLGSQRGPALKGNAFWSKYENDS